MNISAVTAVEPLSGFALLRWQMRKYSVATAGALARGELYLVSSLSARVATVTLAPAVGGVPPAALARVLLAKLADRICYIVLLLGDCLPAGGWVRRRL